jgi:AraC-like DNA-binding protein
MAGDEVRLLPQDRVPLCDAERSALLDIVLMCTQNFVESALGHVMEGARIELPQPPPKHAECYPKLFHAPVRFDCAQAAVVLPARWASLRNPYAEPSLYEAAVRGLHENAQQLRAGQLLVARVEQLLTRRGTSLSRTSAARLLGVSSRTLTRRLQDEGTSYFALLEQSRRAQADALLRDPELSLAEIGHVLGYRDTANFGRAFRRWFDVSPSVYRKRLAPHPRSLE